MSYHATRVEGGWQGIEREPEGFTLYRCPHVHETQEEARSCAWENARDIERRIYEQDGMDWREVEHLR